MTHFNLSKSACLSTPQTNLCFFYFGRDMGKRLQNGWTTNSKLYVVVNHTNEGVKLYHFCWICNQRIWVIFLSWVLMPASESILSNQLFLGARKIPLTFPCMLSSQRIWNMVRDIKDYECMVFWTESYFILLNYIS